MRKVVVFVPNKVPTLPGANRENFPGVNSKFAHICGGLDIDGHKAQMLVRSIEFVKGKQDVIIVVACRVRLTIADEFDGRRGNVFSVFLGSSRSNPLLVRPKGKAVCLVALPEC